ncbi:MAG: catalase/peroxidase [Pseudomonadota bacterium]
MRRLRLSFLVALSFIVFPLNAASSRSPEYTPPQTNKDWWPALLDLSPLRQHSLSSNPYGGSFKYADEFKTLNLDEVKQDIRQVLTTSQPWWPADYGNYGPFFIRMAWHSAGTYRTIDGRGGAAGGQQRFEPLNSWPDNANLDKARRLLWPIKQKYGKKISWADLIVLTGNVSLESMGFKTLGFAGGREDDWEPDVVYWGPEKKWLTSQRFDDKHHLKGPLGATEMGLIYVNPQGPNGSSDPIAAAKDIREAFGRMAMNDEEIVALIAGGHTFGKAHGAHNPDKCLGPAPAGAPIEHQGLGWSNKCGKGNAEDTVTSGLEGAWTASPTQFTNQYLNHLMLFDWVKSKSPAGAVQWIPADRSLHGMVPDAHLADKRHPPIMLTTDITLKADPAFNAIAQRFQKDPAAFSDAFAKAWFKLTHRDMGPRARYVGSEIPAQVFIWQDPLPEVDHPLIEAADIKALKSQIINSGLTIPALVKTAWASASTFRYTDARGGANGARIRLLPQKNWVVNDPAEVAGVLRTLENIAGDFNQAQTNGKKVSVADLIVLGGSAAIETAAKRGGQAIEVPFTPGRVDATQDQTDINSFSVLEPTADGFRNYYASQNSSSPTELLVERASLLRLTIPETTVLIAGLRSLNANVNQSSHGILTQRPETLSNDFFVNLLDDSTQWTKSSKTEGIFEGHDKASGNLKWTATPVDLILGSNSEFRAVAEVYGASDGNEKFVKDFVLAWTKVMNLDRFDLK